MISEKTFDEIAEGDSAQFEITVDDAFVQKFADLSGDSNPLHMNDAFAQKTLIGERVAHGMIASVLFSRLVGMHLPGMHSLYLSQSLFFRKPIRINTTVIISGTVLQKVESMETVKIATVIMDSETGNILIDGEAMVKILV